MKTILLIGILITSIFANTYTVNINNYKPNLDVEKTAKVIVSELRPLLDEPLNWCTVEPTNDITALRKGRNFTKIILSVNVKCDHTTARKLLKNIWNKYDTFLHEHGNIVDSIMERQYPDYHLNWGYGLNDYNFIQLKLLSHFGGTTSFNNKCLFFRLTLNDEFETIPMRIDMPGNLLKIIPTNEISNRPPIKNYRFILTVPNKYLESGKLNIKLDRVWHLVNNEQFIRKY